MIFSAIHREVIEVMASGHNLNIDKVEPATRGALLDLAANGCAEFVRLACGEDWYFITHAGRKAVTV